MTIVFAFGDGVNHYGEAFAAGRLVKIDSVSVMPDQGTVGRSRGVLAQTTGWGTGIPAADPALVLQSVQAHDLGAAGFSTAFSLVSTGGGEPGVGKTG